MAKDEVWKDVVGFEGLYKVSNKGNIYSVERKDTLGRNWGGRTLKPRCDKDGYLIINLYKNGVVKTKKIHRLVTEAFIPNPNSFPVVNHIDGDKANNKASNLEWVTSKENSKHAVKNGLLPSGQDSYKAVFSNDQIRDMRKEYKGGFRLTDLAKKFRVNDSTMHAILNYRTYKNVED